MTPFVRPIQYLGPHSHRLAHNASQPVEHIVGDSDGGRFTSAIYRTRPRIHPATASQTTQAPLQSIMVCTLTESLIAERVAQLDDIIHRRNALLHEMYRMIQHKHNAGSLLSSDETDTSDDDEDEGLKQFMDRFTLGRESESGMITNLSNSELFVPFPPEQVTKEAEIPSVPDIDSPMSEPPVSPTRTKSPAQKEEEEEEEEETEVNDVVKATAEVEPSMSHPSTPVPYQTAEPEEMKQEEEEEEKREEKETVLEGGAEGVMGVKVEQAQPLTPDHRISVPPSPCSPTPPAVASMHPSPAPLQPGSRAPSAQMPSQSPQPIGIEPVTETVEMDISEPMEDIQEESPQLALSSSSPALTEPAEVDIQLGEIITVNEVSASPSPTPVREEPPRLMVIHTAVDVASIQPSLLIPTPTSPAPAVPDFSFEDADGEALEEPPQAPLLTETQHHHFDPTYDLPPLKTLPPEYLRKGKSLKQKKKEKDKADKGGKEEWAPLGFTRWGAIIRANPIYKKVSRATKCLSTRDWSVAIAELRLLRTLDRVEILESEAKWSYRQPKKQRNLGGVTKTHWDYLLDEMKWLRVDFREERRWKYALAFHVSTAVLEWHEAKTREERIKLGICMHWKPPRMSDFISSPVHQRRQQQDMEVDNEGAACEQGEKEQGYSDPESGDDDDEGEVEQRDVVDVLETRNALEEALEGSGSRSGWGESGESSQRQSMAPDGVLRPKVEDVEDSSALENVGGTWQKDADRMDVDGARPDEMDGDKSAGGDAGKTQPTKTEAVDLVGLKPDSVDPMLHCASESQGGTFPVSSPTKSAPKSNLYAPLRERIAYADDNKLFVENDDLDLVKALSDLTTNDLASRDLKATHSPDLSDLFPDLQVLDMPDVAPSEPKKKSDKKLERDDNRRVDDAGYNKIAPMGKFMLCKPTLLSPLQPVRRWKNGRWHPPEEPGVTEAECVSSKITDEQLSELFDGKPQPIGGIFVPHPPRDNKKRLDHAWTSAEDALLKTLVEKYPSNWILVADSFHSARVTISIDRRTPWECFERWNVKFGGKPIGAPSLSDATSTIADGTPPPATPSTFTQQAQMTTRGVKRLASTSIGQGQAGGAGVSIGSDTIKRRRHSLMYETIRKTAKKREATQKAANMNQRKPPNIHDTHGQYSKMPKLTPAELSRMKAEKETREHQELMIVRQRHEELARQRLLRVQQAQAPAAATATTQQQQQQPQPQPQPQQPQQPQPQVSQQPQVPPPPLTGNGATRPATQTSQPTQQIRAQSAVPQVNISQQQRIPTPMTASATVRTSPQMLQVQAAQARAGVITTATQSQSQVPVHTQLHTQAQVQVQAQGTPQAALTSLPAGTHLSPPYHSRAATSSPGIGVTQQASPPRTVVTPSNAGICASPRQPSAQPQPPMPSPQIPGNAMVRTTSSIAAHYLPVVPPGAHFTQEQMDQALRLMQRTTMGQTQQGGHYPSQT